MRVSRPLLVVCLIALALPVGLAAQAGDAEYGKELLRMRGCNGCHVSGGVARDLSLRPAEQFSPDALAASLWNHAPRMRNAMEQHGVRIIPLRESDVSNLYAYFYSLRHFDPAGDPGRGERVFADKGCGGCHAIEAPADASEKPDPDAAPPVDLWTSTFDPTLWIENLWNHGAEMAPRIEQSTDDWPVFTQEEMLDLIEFIESQPPHVGKLPYLRMGDWFAGQHYFASLGCAECHTVGEPTQDKVDLLALARRQPLLSGLAVEMWNHRQAMAAQAEARGLELPVFEPDQLASVLAYLFREGYFQARGDAIRGGAAYNSLGCAECHDGADSPGPRISNLPTPFSAVRLASAVWRHGPGMQAEMDYRDKDWPQLSEQLVTDLVEFIRNR